MAQIYNIADLPGSPVGGRSCMDTRMSLGIEVLHVGPLSHRQPRTRAGPPSQGHPQGDPAWVQGCLWGGGRVGGEACLWE